MNAIELIVSLMRDLDGLTLKSVHDWEIGVRMAQNLISLKHALEDSAKREQESQLAALEEARMKREETLREAAERGEKILGGETIRINADGTQEVLIP